MQIPVFDAVAFIKTMDGGSTKPWLITVDINGSLVSFVLKLYNEKTIDQYNAVVNECIASTLLIDFDLSGPDCALINLTESFKNTLNDSCLKQLNETDDRLKFATRFINPSVMSLLKCRQIGG
tara:strand:+ start:220 stop:588 length:369 start_codon:yes stop_codon:yes gene_type:complete